MASHCLKLRTVSRNLYITSRCYCEKSIYQRDEELAKTKPERVIHGEKYPEWRTPWIKREGEWNSKLSVFIEKNPSPDVLYAMQKVPDFNTQVMREWYAEMKEIKERQEQRYIIDRVTTLGANLAAMHFFTYRNAAVRLRNSNEWLKGMKATGSLPMKFKEGYFVEAIDCTDFNNGIRYEGLENLLELNFLKWLSLKNNSQVDEWCLDRLAGQNGNTLQYLDISGCQLNVNGVTALAKMPELNCLVVTDYGDDLELAAALSILEEEKPNLLIKIVDKE